MVVCLGKRYAVYPSGCLVIITLPFAAIHQASSPIDYQCKACHTRFGIRSFLAKFCLGIIWLFVLWVIGTIACLFFNW